MKSRLLCIAALLSVTACGDSGTGSSVSSGNVNVLPAFPPADSASLTATLETRFSSAESYDYWHCVLEDNSETYILLPRLGTFVDAAGLQRGLQVSAPGETEWVSTLWEATSANSFMLEYPDSGVAFDYTDLVFSNENSMSFNNVSVGVINCNRGSFESEGLNGGSETASLELPVLSRDSFLLGNIIQGRMHRYDPFTGDQELFSSPDDWGSRSDYTGSVDISNNMIITVDETSAMVALDADSGDYLWSLPLGDFLFDSSLSAPTSPVCAGDVCYAMGAGGDVVAIDVVTRQILWQSDLFPSVERALLQYPLIVTEDRIFAGASSVTPPFGEIEPKLNVLSRLTGEVLTEIPAGRAYVDDDLLFITGESRMHAYDLITLEPVWSIDLSGVSIPAVVGDVVVVNAPAPSVGLVAMQRVIGLSRQDGSLLWERDAGLLQSFFQPTTDGRLIYTAFAVTCGAVARCTNGHPMALNPEDGSIVWMNNDVDIKQTKAPIIVSGEIFYDEIITFESSIGIRRLTASLSATDGDIKYFSNSPPFNSLTIINNGTAIRSASDPGFISNRLR